MESLLFKIRNHQKIPLTRCTNFGLFFFLQKITPIYEWKNIPHSLTVSTSMRETTVPFPASQKSIKIF